MEQLRSFGDYVRYVRENYSNPTALNYYDAEGWHSISTEVCMQYIRHLALAFVSLGLKKGDCVGILAYSSPFWTLADLAIMIAGGVSVPLFANISDDNFVFEVTQTKLKFICIDGPEPWEHYQHHKKLFDVVIAFQDHPREQNILSWQEAIALGEEYEKKHPKLYEELESSLKGDDLAAIIYTSGSTGVPKGVELTHKSLTCVSLFNGFNWHWKQDRYLSILPLAHVFGHCVNLWAALWGISIYYSNDYKNLGAVCREVKPTAIVVVPRLLEKIYAKMNDQIQHANFLKNKIGLWALSVAQIEGNSLYKRLMHPLAEKLVFSKLRDALGGCLKTVISGGAPLNPHLHNIFQEIGIPIYEGWGLTEACPVCVNVPEKNKVGTVGPPLYGQKLAISAENEVLVKGGLVMRGYFCNPEATAKVIDKDGWLHTGDRGSLDEDGYLTILGRLKELYKTSTGEYVAPVPIEQALCRHPLVEMAMVIAEGRKFTSCLLFPNFEAVKRLKDERKASNQSDQEFLNSPNVRNQMEAFIEELNYHLNHWEQLHEYRFILEPLTIEGGELTPSMKIKREVVAKKYQKLIDSMYQEEVS